MIINFGKFKNSKLIFPKYFYNIKNFLPTPSYIKEKIFNWLGNLNGFYCLDLFSCTGSLGFEAASLGCKSSVLLEKNKIFYNFLKKNKFKINIYNSKVFNVDCFAYIKSFCNNNFYDLIFIDSPYIDFDKLVFSIKKCLKILKKNSFLYVETIFDINLIEKFFIKKIILVKNNFFNKINFSIFKVL